MIEKFLQTHDLSEPPIVIVKEGLVPCPYEWRVTYSKSEGFVTPGEDITLGWCTRSQSTGKSVTDHPWPRTPRSRFIPLWIRRTTRTVLIILGNKDWLLRTQKPVVGTLPTSKHSSRFRFNNQTFIPFSSLESIKNCHPTHVPTYTWKRIPSAYHSLVPFSDPLPTLKRPILTLRPYLREHLLVTHVPKRVVPLEHTPLHSLSRLPHLIPVECLKKFKFCSRNTTFRGSLF